MSRMSGDASSSSGQVHEARHFQYSRRMITPTHPVEGDWLKIETEEAIFGAIFAGHRIALEMLGSSSMRNGRAPRSRASLTNDLARFEATVTF